MRLYLAALGCALALGACRFGYELLPLDEAAGAPASAGDAGTTSRGGGGAAGFGASSGMASGGASAGAAGEAGASGAGQAGEPGCGDGVVQPGEECEPALSPSEDLCQADCSYHWFDRSYAKRRRVTFANPGASELVGFVVPVVLSPNDLDYAALEPDGADLLFVDATDQTTLSYELEAFVPGSISVAWLRFPSIPASGSVSAWLYAERPGATAAQNPAQTWAGAFAAVYHLNGDAQDSLALSNGAITGAKAATGQLADGLDFATSNDMVDAGSAPAVDDLFATGGTITAWIHPRGWGEGTFGRVADKASDTLTAAGWALQVDGGTAPNHALIFEHGFSGGLGRWNGPDSSIALGAWAHIAVVYNASSAANQPLVYVNGAVETLTVLNTPTGTRASDAANRLGIGDQVATKQRSFDGVLDELRLEKTTRSPDWIKAEYRSMLPGAVTFAAAQSHL